MLVLSIFGCENVIIDDMHIGFTASMSMFNAADMGATSKYVDITTNINVINFNLKYIL